MQEDLSLSVDEANPVEYRALKSAAVYEQADFNAVKITDLAKGEIFQVVSVVAKKSGASGAEVKFAEIRHDRVTEKDHETGWVQMTTNKGEVLCATEAAVQQLLQSVPLLEKLSSRDRLAIANVLEGSSYVEDQAIIEFGATGKGCKHMYFVESGTAFATIGRDVVREYHSNDFFGELALLTDEPRKATVLAGKDGCRCLKLGRDAFNTFASDCEEVLNLRRKQYAMVHLIDVSEAALKSYQQRPDLRENRPGSREFAPCPSLSALKLLCKLIANAPARVKTSDAALGHQHLERVINADGYAESVLENDIAMIAKVLAKAMNRMDTTYLDPKLREEADQSREADEQKERARSHFSNRTLGSSGKAMSSDGNVTPLARPSSPGSRPIFSISTPGNRPAMGTPSSNTASLAAEAVPSVDPGHLKFALNRSQRDHVRNFMAIARDLQLMMEKYGFSEDDLLQPFRDPTYVFGRKRGDWRIPFVESRRIEQSDVDRLLVVVSRRLRPRGSRTHKEEQTFEELTRALKTDRAELERTRQTSEPSRVKLLESSCRHTEEKIAKLEEMLPFGHAGAFHNALTEFEGHTLATLCEIPRFRAMLTSEKYDHKRAATLVDTLIEGLLLDPNQPRKLHDPESFERVAPAIQRDFARCFHQLCRDNTYRKKLLEDDRVVKSLCMIAVADMSQGAQPFAKEALKELNPDPLDEKTKWHKKLVAITTKGKWPEGTEGGKPYAQQLERGIAEELDKRKRDAPAPSKLPEGDPATATATSPVSSTSPTDAVRAQAGYPAMKSSSSDLAHKVEKTAQKLKVKGGAASWATLKKAGQNPKPSILMNKTAKMATTNQGRNGPEATVAHTVTREIKQKNIHREAEDLCNFFESAIVPFAKLFIDTDDFAMEVIGQWATVVYRDMFQMKICCKVLIKAYDYRSKLFLVEWGDGEKTEQNEWLNLQDIVAGRAGARATDCWLGIQAKATDADKELAEEVCKRRCGTKRLDGTPVFRCWMCDAVGI